jgi:hypothetical protein
MKTAICLENLSYSYFSKELISEINKYVIDSTDEICLVTFDETTPFANVNTAVFTPSELDSFHNGVIISHKISHAMSILGCSNNSKKVLYLYDLDWMFEPMIFNDLYNVLTDENLILILRSEDHVSPIKNLCNREPDAIVKNFSLEKIWNSL